MGHMMQKISRAGLVMLLIGGALLAVSLGDTIISFKPARSFEDVLESGAAPGDHVAGRVPYLLDSFASTVTWSENTKTHSTTPKKTSSRCYVLPGGDGYLGLTVYSRSLSQAGDLVDQTYGYLAGGSVPTAELSVDARVVAMDEDMAEMFRQELQEYYGYTDQDIQEMDAVLMVEPRAFGTIRAFCGVGAVVFMLGAAVMILRWRKVSAQLRRAQELGSGPEIG